MDALKYITFKKVFTIFVAFAVVFGPHPSAVTTLGLTILGISSLHLFIAERNAKLAGREA
jgi:hypothetical protein